MSEKGSIPDSMIPGSKPVSQTPEGYEFREVSAFYFLDKIADIQEKTLASILHNLYPGISEETTGKITRDFTDTVMAQLFNEVNNTTINDLREASVRVPESIDPSTER